jgi:hypothetical protein
MNLVVIGPFPKDFSFITLKYSPDSERIYTSGTTDLKSETWILVLESLSGYIIKSHCFENRGYNFLGTFSHDTKTVALWRPYEMFKIIESNSFIKTIPSNQSLKMA